MEEFLKFEKIKREWKKSRGGAVAPLPLLAEAHDFRPVTLWSQDRALLNSVCVNRFEAPALCASFRFSCQVVCELYANH